MLGPGEPVQARRRRAPDRRQRSEPAAAEPPARWRSTRRCSTSATSGSPCRSRSRSPRSSPVASARAGSPTPAARRSSRGGSSPSASSSARGGATRCSAGAATGRWDPVENASLLPWLTATAFIHSVMVQERRGMLRVWNLSLVIATFCAHDPRHVPHPLRRHQLGARVLAVVDRPVAAHVPRDRDRGDRHRADRVARRQAARAGPDRLAGVARGRVPREQPVVRRARVRRAARHRVPAARRGGPRHARCRWGSRTSTGWARRSASLLLFLMAVAPALPWRATSGEVLAEPAARPGVDRRRHDAAHRRAVGTRDWPTVLGFGLARVRGRRDRRTQTFVAVRARRRADAVGWGSRVASRTVGGEPAPLRRARRAPRCRRDRGGAGAQSGVRHQARGAPRRGRVGDGRPATRSPTSGRDRASVGPEGLGVGRRCGSTRGGDVTRRLRRRHLHVLEREQGIGTPSVHTGVLDDVYLTLVVVAERQGPRSPSASQIQPLMVWLWIGGAAHGARHRGRAAAAHPAHGGRAVVAGRGGRRPTTTSGRTTSPSPTPTWSGPARRYEASLPLDRARRGRARRRRSRVVLAVNVGTDPRADREHEQARRQARRPS